MPSVIAQNISILPAIDNALSPNSATFETFGIFDIETVAPLAELAILTAASDAFCIVL